MTVSSVASRRWRRRPVVQKSVKTFGATGKSIMRWVSRMPTMSSAGSRRPSCRSRRPSRSDRACVHSSVRLVTPHRPCPSSRCPRRKAPAPGLLFRRELVGGHQLDRGARQDALAPVPVPMRPCSASCGRRRDSRRRSRPARPPPEGTAAGGSSGCCVRRRRRRAPSSRDRCDRRWPTGPAWRPAREAGVPHAERLEQIGPAGSRRATGPRRARSARPARRRPV